MLTKKRVVGATALVVVVAAIGTVPAIAGQDPKPGKTEVGNAVSWTSKDGAAYISDFSNMPRNKKWKREHQHGTGPYPGRFQEEVGPDWNAGHATPGVPTGAGTETPTSTATVTTDPNVPTGTATTEPGAVDSTTNTTTSTQEPTATGEPTGTTEPTGTSGATGTTTGTATGTPTSGGTATPCVTSTGTSTGTATGTATATASATVGETATPTETMTASDIPELTSSTTTASGKLTPCSTSNRSGLPWGASGLYMPGSSAANAEAFAAWRGAPVDVVVDWPARQTWDDIVNPTWIFDAWKDTPYLKALGVAPVPEGDSSATMAGCAAGQYNDKWTQFGQNFVSNGMGDSIIRLGWEFNGNWYKWSASNPTEYAECFRQIVTTVRAVAPDLKWDWTVNRGVSAGLADATQAYPGDDYVDYVGIDSYDMWPGANNDQTWDEHLNGDFGLKFWADFARQHGKKVTVPEWGCYPGTAQAGHNGGDNALYISKMVEFFKSLGSDLAYEAYFNEDASYYAGAIFEPVQVPNAAGTYKELVAEASQE
ncbi:hypothetical protein KIH74_16710 [Kineosporia sp. J2-2]|uniref:GH26 domain-containing protein n=1 Tax=Kineosporia corallincola TaxID=2835133 RepID=A0ABS5THM1_9ACTN|nr:glycosyl hydrolase [Kineosporia corallincola]MBT0770587.1 hypothetical protein [Kineosporia corallincola]